MILYKNEEIYGESIEYYDISASLQPNINGNILEKFVKMIDVNDGIVLDIGAGTGKNAIELAKHIPDKEIIALEPSKYMRIAFMSKLIEHSNMQKQITVLPISVEEYNFKEMVSGVLCMGVLGHLSTEGRTDLWRKLKCNLQPNVPVLIEILDRKFLNITKGKRISVSYQGRLRYETFVNDVKTVEKNKWEWSMLYKVFDGENLIKINECPMSWTYDSVESILKELTDIKFRTVKLSDTLLIAKKS